MLSLVTLEDKFDLICAVTNRGAHKETKKLPATSQKSATRPGPWRFSFIAVAGARLCESNVGVPIGLQPAVPKVPAVPNVPPAEETGYFSDF